MHAAAATPPPANPIAAATHADPYPYYAQLVRERPLHWDGELGLWSAADAASVTALLSHPACRVRPTREPVPQPLLGSPLGALFTRLIRMTDGPAREAPREAAVQAFTQLSPEALRAQAEAAAVQLAPREPRDGEALTDFILALPLQVTAALLGVAPERRPQVVHGAQRLVAALSPLATAQEREAGGVALESLIADLASPREGALLAAFSRSARHAGVDQPTLLTNAIGFLTQSCEATAGLIGNALLALGRDPQLLAAVRAQPELLLPLLEEVLRYDPPVQNTRRFLATALPLGETLLEEGQQVLLLLAAANRDPALNPEPQRLLLQRARRRHLTFGLGAHACPGSQLATAIAEAGVRRLLERDMDPTALPPVFRYRPSLNGRVPLFHAPGSAITKGGRA